MILIVDDEEALARIYSRILNAHGFVSEYVGMGAYALSVIERKNPDFVIVDLSLPDMNGIELAEAARANGYTGPIMLISGTVSVESDPNLKYLAEKIENFNFVEKKQKPIHTPELVEIVSKYVKPQEKDET